MAPVSRPVPIALLLAAALVSSAQPLPTTTFGRFGYGAPPAIPGWQVDKRGFKPHDPLADEIEFIQPASEWKARVVSSNQETVELGRAPVGNPSMLSFQMDAPGFSMRFEQGIDLRVRSTSAPFLSWAEGSVAQTVPTPALDWVLMSYRTDQPPVLFAFAGDPTAMVVTGSPGDWHVRSTTPYRGWMRALLPLGLSSASPKTAAGLGELSEKVSANATLWKGGSPQLQGVQIQQDAGSLTATWTYDKPGAVIPQAILLAPYGGYPLHLLTDSVRLESNSEEGPAALSRDAKITVRFPILPISPWRYLAIGSSDGFVKPPEPTVASVTELAFAVLAANCDRKVMTHAGDALMSFLGKTPRAVEPATSLALPYEATGINYDLASAHALLTQAVATANGSPGLPNPLLDLLFARIDAYDWRPWAMDESLARRAAALSAVAYAMRSNDEDRLRAAMLQAGLSAQRGMDIWRRRVSADAKPPVHAEVLEDLRARIFSLEGRGSEASEWDQLFSPLHSYVNFPIELQSVNGKLLLNWMSLTPEATEIGLLSQWPLKIGAGQNLERVSATQAGDSFVVRFKPKDVGWCALELILPSGTPLPPASVPLKYVEQAR